MEYIKCRNGHRYDPSVSAECPECAKLAGHTVPLGATSFGPADDIGKTMPLSGGRDTVPVNPKNGNWADASDWKTAGNVSESYNPTMPLNYDKGGLNDQAARPVTGWLVCIDGPEKGKDYRLHDEYNYIGRTAKNDVVIPSDETISRERHAVIAYDTRGRMFFFAPANGSSIVRLNGRPTLQSVELKQGDRLEIGKCTFLFVPLCGENFQWED